MAVCFYADLYWILNFIMNLFLLYITAWWLNEPASVRRWVLSSAVCAVIPVINIIASQSGVKVPQVLTAILELGLLVYWAYKPAGIRQFLNKLINFILISAFTAGMLFMLKGIFSKGGESSQKFSLLFLLISVFMLYILFRFLRIAIAKQELRQRSVVNVTLVHNGRKQVIKALFDTGNHLISPYTGEPVFIISKELSDSLGLKKDLAPLLIPYNSIGGRGLLEAYRLEWMQLQDGSTRENFLAAVSGNICTDKEIQMILNNQHMAEGGHNA
ncbi:MAG: sigma-E processing peptidase SpoIIGA [Lachnospiraceae bacterium]|nr:sigma-E processing peptidase SpoIIGA [Lachnospiraceae bacterium]